MKNQKDTLQKFKDISFIVFMLTVSFSAGGFYFATKAANKELKILNVNFDKLIIHLKVRKVIPENFCKIEDEKTHFMTDNTTYGKKPSRRIALHETVLDNGNFENKITE